jgi:hypothetical protein
MGHKVVIRRLEVEDNNTWKMAIYTNTLLSNVGSRAKFKIYLCHFRQSLIMLESTKQFLLLHRTGKLVKTVNLPQQNVYLRSFKVLVFIFLYEYTRWHSKNTKAIKMRIKKNV